MLVRRSPSAITVVSVLLGTWCLARTTTTTTTALVRNPGRSFKQCCWTGASSSALAFTPAPNFLHPAAFQRRRNLLVINMQEGSSSSINSAIDAIDAAAAAASRTTATTTTATAVPRTPLPTSSLPPVNLLDLAAASVACTVTASRKILALSSFERDAKNARLKQDGSFVTDADYAAQGVIVQAIRKVSEHVRIVGEESAEEMARHVSAPGDDNNDEDVLDAGIYQRSRSELRIRRSASTNSATTTAATATSTAVDHSPLPLGPLTSDASAHPLPPFAVSDVQDADDPPDFWVDPSRVSVIVDPLDGTKSYAHGDYDAVSILVGIVLDNTPWFGVIGKPFGYTGLTGILDTGCVAVYGGPLLNGVFVAGGAPVTPIPIDDTRQSALEDLPRAVISGSRSKGVVNDFCVHLGERGLVYPEPLLISGAGEKSLRLILQKNNEALWFFPKAGTSRWDVAAPDALLRSLGGRMTDKYGNELDYSKSRDDAENVDGIVACIDAKLHAECVRLFKEGDWSDRK